MASTVEQNTTPLPDDIAPLHAMVLVMQLVTGDQVGHSPINAEVTIDHRVPTVAIFSTTVCARK